METMRPNGPHLYGHELGRRFGVLSPQTLMLGSEMSSTMAITSIQSDEGTMGWTEPIRPERGFMIPVYLEKGDTSDWVTSIIGLTHKVPLWQDGGMGIYDLESDPRVIRNGAVDSLHFNLPRTTLNAFTEDAGLPLVSELKCVEGQRDDIVYHLAKMILPSVAREQRLPTLFFDYFIQVFCSRIVSAYSLRPSVATVHRGGLAPWQKRRTLEVLDHHLSGDLRLSRLAAECGLSSSHFSRCFRKSFGVSVHQFVIQKRVERARALLVESKSSLVEIAIESGFSDQAALSRTFSGIMGVPPARWKTEHMAKARFRVHPILCSEQASASQVSGVDF